jgi:type II secretory pathway predicted ATPase ExeA
MNFVTDQRLLIVIVLAGQEELAPKIQKRAELKSRMQALSLSSLSLDDAKALIQWRWQVASNDPANPLPFDDLALEEVYRIAVGLPRDICTLCNRSLQYAYAEERKVITSDLVLAAAKSLQFIYNGHQQS